MLFLDDIRTVRIYFAVGLAGVVAYHWLDSRYLYWAIGAYALAAAFIGALREPRGERLPWIVIASGLACFIAGDVAWEILDMLGPVPQSPNVSDGFYLVGYPVFGVGLFLLGRRLSRDIGLTIDALIVGVAVCTAIWPLLFATFVHGNSQPLGTRLTIGVYPCWDMLYVVLAVRIAAARALHPRRAALLVGSLVFYLLGDLFWFKSIDTYVLGDWIDPLWLAAYVGLGTAALHPIRSIRDERADTAPFRRYVLLAVPVALLPASLVVEHVLGKPFDAVDALAVSLLLLLVLARLGGVLRGLERTRAELREQNRLKDELISVVSHDLRTPLTSIMGYLELALADDTDPLSAREFLEVVKRNTGRLHRLVEDLLFVSRVQSGREALDLAPVDVAQLAEQTVAAAVPVADSADVVLECVTMTRDVVVADDHRLAEVLENLLSNAVKFTPPGGRVDVWVGRGAGGIVLRVSDTGVGIAAEDCRHLFDRFYRASGSDGVPGAGLGLSIVKAIVEAHGGTVGVQSEIGVGTTFEVRLPLESAAQALEPVAA